MRTDFSTLIELKQDVFEVVQNLWMARDPEALASFFRQSADEVWLEAADCFLADLMNCFSRHLPLASSLRSWLIRTAPAVNELSDKLGISRWKGGGPRSNQKEEAEEW